MGGSSITEGKLQKNCERNCQGKSILVGGSAGLELTRVRVIGSQLALRLLYCPTQRFNGTLAECFALEQ